MLVWFINCPIPCEDTVYSYNNKKHYAQLVKSPVVGIKCAEIL